MKRTALDQEIVVLGGVLSHRLTNGYECQELQCQDPLYKVNGVEIRKLADVVSAVAAARTSGAELVTFEFCSKYRIVLPVVEGFAASWEIKEDYGMPALLSNDLAETLAAQGLAPLTPDGAATAVPVVDTAAGQS